MHAFPKRILVKFNYSTERAVTMKKKFCNICGKEVCPEDLVVKIQENGKTVDAVFVHCGECDDRLKEQCENEGKSANAALNLSIFETDEEIDQYKNDKFYLSDTELIERHMDKNGHLKK